MKRIIVSLFVYGSLSTLAVAAGTHARACSNASLRGAYGFQTGGIIVPDGTPRGNLGRWVFDGAGNFTNALTVNDNGTIIPVTDAGTYTVNADCTGTISPDSGGSDDIVLVDGGNEFHLLRTDPQNWVMLFSVAKKQFPADDER
jgi:hypothetical protein